MENNTENTAQKVQKIADIIDIVYNFIDLLEEENEAIEDGNMDIVKELSDQKIHIANIYRSHVAYVIKNRDYVKELESEEKDELKEASLQLDELIKENAKLLEVKMNVTESVIDTIVNYSKKHNELNSTSYSSKGHFSEQDNNKNAISINKEL